MLFFLVRAAYKKKVWAHSSENCKVKVPKKEGLRVEKREEVVKVYRLRYSHGFQTSY